MTHLLLLLACSPSDSNPASGEGRHETTVPPAPGGPSGPEMVESLGSQASAPLGAPGLAPPTPPSRCPAGDASCIDLATVPPLWTTAASWDLGSVELAGDINADGLQDVFVRLGQGDSVHTSLVYGPLLRPLVLPDDEDVGFSNASIRTIGDLTGDGEPDLVLVNPDDLGGWIVSPDVVLPGPLTTGADIATDPRVIPLATRGTDYLDWNGDGVTDLFDNSRDDATGVVGRVWLGGLASWGVAPPDVELTWSCALDLVDVHPIAGRTDDMDGDGVDELWLGLATSAPDCSGAGLPATATGTIDVPTTPLRLDGEGGTFYGDMDGDGAGEWRISGTGFDPDRYLTEPISFAGGAAVGASEVTIDPVLADEGVIPVWVDLDGDSVSEHYTSTRDEFGTNTGWFVTGGSNGGLFTGIPLFTLISDNSEGPGDFLLESGRMIVICPENTVNPPAGVRLVEIPISGATTVPH